jgi:hypothetical protein
MVPLTQVMIFKSEGITSSSSPPYKPPSTPWCLSLRSCYFKGGYHEFLCNHSRLHGASHSGHAILREGSTSSSSPLYKPPSTPWCLSLRSSYFKGRYHEFISTVQTTLDSMVPLTQVKLFQGKVSRVHLHRANHPRLHGASHSGQAISREGITSSSPPCKPPSTPGCLSLRSSYFKGRYHKFISTVQTTLDSRVPLTQVKLFQGKISQVHLHRANHPRLHGASHSGHAISRECITSSHFYCENHPRLHGASHSGHAF